MSEDVLVTGGAGFIGSHLIEALIRRGHRVRVLDNLSSGKKTNLDSVSDSQRLKFLVGDCRSADDVEKAIEGVHTVFHFAANPEVRLEISDPNMCYEHNILATHILLEKVRKSDVQTIVFPSSSTIYGEPKIIPTPEDYGPLEPISVYGASKLACEALISSYCHSFKKRGLILRLANIIGPRSSHGVISDFVRKLRANPLELEILGDGSQTKSYLYIDDFTEAVIRSYESGDGPVAICNVGSEDQTSVAEIAKIVTEEMDLNNVKLSFSGGLGGGRGWVGDVRQMLLDTKKIKSLGWKPRLNSKEAVRKTAKQLVQALQ